MVDAARRCSSDAVFALSSGRPPHATVVSASLSLHTFGAAAMTYIGGNWSEDALWEKSLESDIDGDNERDNQYDYADTTT